MDNDDEDEPRHNMVDSDGVRVQAEKCKTCIFRPGNLMHLQAGRVKGMVDDCKDTEGVIPCHDTLDGDKQAICRGFFDSYQDDIPLVQLAVRMGFIKEVQVP
jgi:hypothetical protein